MKISTDEVEKIAHLARLYIDDNLKEALSGQLSNILEYIDKLKNVDIQGVKSSSGAAFLFNAFREDQVNSSPGVDLTLAGAPERDKDFYVVPRVVK